MPLTTKTYRINFKNVEGVLVTIEITDIESIPFEGADVEFIDLTGGESPLVISTVNNSDDILQPILGTKATITFKKTDEVGISTFSTGEDRRFSVWIGAIGFRGFLVMDEQQELYLPPGQDVTIVATDNLGILRDIELSDSTGAKLRDKHTIIKYVYECLLKTGPVYNGEMEIAVMNNLYEDSHADRTANIKNCPWEQTYIDALTFEAGEPNKFDDCYTVLEKILTSWGMRLFWYAGKWWIVRLDEYKESNALTSSTMWYTVYRDGVSATGHEALFEKTIDTDKSYEGVPAERHVYGDPSLVNVQRPFKSAECIYKYEQPQEMIKNINFERGAFNSALSGVGYSAFDVDDWTAHKDFPPYTDPPTFTPYLKRVFDVNGYEIERYLVLSLPTTSAIQYLESSAWDVCEGGKFEISIDYKWDINPFGGGSLTIDLMNVRLEADDGSHYTLDDDGKWYLSNASWTTFVKDLEVQWVLNDVDEREWRTYSVTAEPIPKIGVVYFMLRAMNQDAGLTDDNAQIHFSNISITYFQKINGVYSPFKSESYKIQRDGNYSAKRESQLFMADAPCKPYKGAMFTLDGTYTLTNLWLDWKLANASPAPVVSTPNRFAWWQTYAMWNQYRLGKRIFQGNWNGIDSGTSEPLWLLHRIKITTVSEHNQNRKFIFLSMEQDLYRCTYSGVLAEIDNITDPRSFAETLEFKYLLTG